jgi:hypothetical protein
MILDIERFFPLDPPLHSGNPRSEGGVSAKPAGLVLLTEGAACCRRKAPSVADFAAPPTPEDALQGRNK